MPLDDEEPDASEQEFSDFVAAVFARSTEEAEEYRELLEDHDIPAIVGEEDSPEDEEERRARSWFRRGMTRGVPVLVPEVLLDEASEVIADRGDLDELDEEDQEDEEEEEDEGLGLTEELEEETDEEIEGTLDEEEQPLRESESLEDDELEEEDDEKEP